MKNIIIGIMSFLVAFNVCVAATLNVNKESETNYLDSFKEVSIAEASIIENKNEKSGMFDALNLVKNVPVFDELNNANRLLAFDRKDQAVMDNASKQTNNSLEKAQVYYENSQKDLKDMLGGITNIIKNYAETEGIEESSKRLFSDLSIFSNDLNKRVEKYKDEDLYSKKNDDSLERMQELANKGVFVNPLKVAQGYSNLLHNLFGKMSDQDLLINIRTVVKPDLPAEKRYLRVVEKKHVIVDCGVVTEDVYYKEVEEIGEVMTEMMSQEDARQVLGYL